MIDGVLNIYKEPGYTSHDVVARLRGILGQKKIGHMGTLDPNAVGVLPVCLGKGTKLCSILSDKDKTYNAVMLLGVVTDTQDTTGNIISRTDLNSVKGLDEEAVINAVKSFLGEYEQTPPMFSAVKIMGERLYNIARRGEEVEREPRKRIISDIFIRNIDLPRVEFDVTCSSGTYIRTLCSDIGEKLGTGACMEKLLRTRVERMDVKDSITLEDVEKFRDNDTLLQYVIPVDEMLDSYSKCKVGEDAEKLVENGNIFTSGNTMLKMNHSDGQIVRVYTYKGKFVGLYVFSEDRQIYKPYKMFI